MLWIVKLQLDNFFFQFGIRDIQINVKNRNRVLSIIFGSLYTFENVSICK